MIIFLYVCSVLLGVFTQCHWQCLHHMAHCLGPGGRVIRETRNPYIRGPRSSSICGLWEDWLSGRLTCSQAAPPPTNTIGPNSSASWNIRFPEGLTEYKNDYSANPVVWCCIFHSCVNVDIHLKHQQHQVLVTNQSISKSKWLFLIQMFILAFFRHASYGNSHNVRAILQLFSSELKKLCYEGRKLFSVLSPSWAGETASHIKSYYRGWKERRQKILCEVKETSACQCA